MAVKSKFPVTIDKPPLFLVWEVDEFMVLTIPLVLSLFVRELLVGLLIGIVLMWGYIKIKKDKPNNFYFHLFWLWGIMNVKQTPPPYIKKFLE